MTRRGITEEVERLSVYDFDGPLDGAIKMLTDLKNKYPGDLRLGVDYIYYDDTNRVSVFHTRMETDAEMNARKRKERKAAEARRKRKEELAADQETKDRELYEKLKARFETS